MDTISVLIGFLVGVIATAIAVEFGLKKIFRPPAQSKVTASWRIADHKAPLVVSQDASAVLFPPGARVVTAGGAHPDGQHRRDFRRNPNARSNYLVEADRDRATLLLGPLQEGTLALATVDPVLVARLRAEHRRLWETGEPLVEETGLAATVNHVGQLVRTRGRVQDCIPYRERHLLRVSDGNATLGVLVDEALQLAGQTVTIVGRVVRGTTGYPLIDAEEVGVVSAAGGRAPTRPAAAPSAPEPRARPEPVTPPSAPPRNVQREPGPAPTGETDAPGPMEFESVEPVATEAERRRRAARVVLHR